MRCPGCGFDNREEMKFCVQCATPLTPRCPQCGFENPPGSAFCGQCATPLTERQQEKGRKGERAKRSEEQLSLQTLDSRLQTLDSSPERRQLTVMCCDLVGSTPLAAK